MTEHERDEMFERLVLAIEHIANPKELIEGREKALEENREHNRACEISHREQREKWDEWDRKIAEHFTNLIKRIEVLESKNEPWRE